MALGFGFNKTKVLQAAERYVLQGKLQSAISEYEKIVQADPGDLTIANTLGDLYVRVGRLDDSLQCFRKVADAYAGNGFMVKAIAMYKKMAKISPNAVDCMLKLAEMYGQQGLFSDARAQYTSVAELHLRNGDSEAAAGVYRKVLELDPENAAMQQRLADLYRRAGRNAEAADIYVMAAQSLHCRKNLPQAMEAVEKVLSFEPHHAAAVLLRAKIATDSGQPATAMQALQSLPGLDQRADALHELLRAANAAGDLGEAHAAALKLLRVHNDPAGLLESAAAMVNAGEAERALKLVREHVEAIATPAAGELAAFLNESLAKAKGSVTALETICELYRMIGERGSSHEASELLAHAYADCGRLAEAREIYHHLAQAEPENPTHHQNYARLAAELGEADPQVVKLAPEEEAVVPEQLPDHEVSVPQQYLSQIEEAIESALTDSDLFQSYNAMPRAIAPLEAVLVRAPEDIRLNQRLAALYVRVERYADAAARFAVLRQVFEREHLESEAAQCAEMEQKYHARAEMQPSSDQNVAEDAAENAAPAPAEAPRLELAAAAEPAQPTASEWEQMLQPTGAQASEPETAVPTNDVAAHLAEVLEEARFYMQQGMHREAQAALERCRQLAPEDPAVVALGDELGLPTVDAQAPEKLPLMAYSEEPQQPAMAPEIHAEVPAEPVNREIAAEAAPAQVVASSVSTENPVVEAPLAASAEQVEIAAPAAASSPSAPSVAEQVAAAASFDMGWHIDAAPAKTEKEDFSMDGIFNEFRAEVEKSDSNDLESRYNLGVALKDMGLLDEAIGELQQVCTAVERGAHFAEAVQAYTWLAHCLVERGVPQAAFKWYQKALQLPGLDPEAITAIHYELAQAYERAGIKDNALQHFMEAYGNNIDYRDVAERIHELQA